MKRSIFVSEKVINLHHRICRRCGDAFKGGRQSKYCVGCYVLNNRGLKKGQTNSGSFKKGKISWNKGLKLKPLSKETKRKISLSHKGKKLPEETKKKISKSKIGHFVSKETKGKISESEKGKIIPEEVRKKISESLMGEKNHFFGKHLSKEHRIKISLSSKNNSNYGMRGKHHSEETKKKMSLVSKGKSKSEDHKRKIGISHKGNKSYLWNGGISYEPYSSDWTDTLKRAIRQRDRYICQICGEEGIQVHHIDYNKKNCNIINLITLCNKCHAKTNINRNKWIEYFLKRKFIRK